MDPVPPDPGLLGGRYRLGGLLGRGGMADVYDGFDERLARPVAIKILRAAATEDTAMRTRFEREARSVARLSHPAVVAVYDSGEDQGRAYMVMERLPGETLADHMRLGPVDPLWLAPILVDVLGALAAAHALGMVHRDIKPANILLAADGRAKVADFGIAKSYLDGIGAGGEDLTATGLIIGTVAYLSPEQISGAPASPQGDIYAVGVVAYEALAGRKPFVGDNAVAQARAVAEGHPADLTTGRPDIDPRLAAVVRRAMARRVEDRYLSAAAMRADLVATGLATPGGVDAPTAVALPPQLGGPPSDAATELLAPEPTSQWARPGGAETVALAGAVGAVPAALPATTVMPAAAGGPPPSPTTTTPPPGPTPAPRHHAGLIGALVTLAVVVVAAAVVAILVERNNSPRTIPPASTAPTTAPVASTSGAPVVVPATSTTSTSTSTSSTTTTTVAPTTTTTSTTSTTTTPTSTTTTTLPATTTSTTSTTTAADTAASDPPGPGTTTTTAETSLAGIDPSWRGQLRRHNRG